MQEFVENDQCQFEFLNERSFEFYILKDANSNSQAYMYKLVSCISSLAVETKSFDFSVFRNGYVLCFEVIIIKEMNWFPNYCRE
jgi:hypothetical protein